MGHPKHPGCDTLFFTDTLRPGTLPSLSDLGEPVEAVKREEKKVRLGWSRAGWDLGWLGWGCLL